ncbi:hypothetical protein PENTCL1PPCAC_15746, partial [Pristionchus entomophagus]
LNSRRRLPTCGKSRMTKSQSELLSESCSKQSRTPNRLAPLSSPIVRRYLAVSSEIICVRYRAAISRAKSLVSKLSASPECEANKRQEF